MTALLEYLNLDIYVKIEHLLYYTRTHQKDRGRAYQVSLHFSVSSILQDYPQQDMVFYQVRTLPSR